MKQLKIEFLINNCIDYLLKNINPVFEELIESIKSYLDLDVVYKEIKVYLFKENDGFKNKSNNFFNLGVRRVIKDESLKIGVNSSYKNFIRLILMREAYKCFIPLSLKDNENINIFISQRIEIDLHGSEFINDWKDLKRRYVVNYEFIEAEYDRLENFLKQESSENLICPIQFFFIYVRDNAQIIGDVGENFYDLIFQEYFSRYTEYNEDILETIRIITYIFYKVKNYESLLDYQNLFKQLKESKEIDTKLSLRKFNENMQWIKNFSTIAPNYQINWPALNIISIICTLKFHPMINNYKIHNIIKNFPFFIWSRYSKNSFSIEFFGYFFIPKIYLNDLIDVLAKMESNGLIVDKSLYIITDPGFTINLNGFVGALNKNVILDPNKIGYKKEFELEFNFDYGYGTYNSDLAVLDWLIIDRIRYYSTSGLGFERKRKTLSHLKSDLLNEISSQRNLISEIKENLNLIYNSDELKKNFLNFIENNRSFGFFYIKQKLNDSIILFDLLANMLEENPAISNYAELLEIVIKKGISKTIEDNILLNKFKENIPRDVLSLLFVSKKDYNENIEKYRLFFKIFKLFYDLKLFNLKSIISIINDNSLIQKIYQSKEEKLRQSFESFKLYKITNQLIEQKLEDFLKNNPPIIKPNLLSTIIISRYSQYSLFLILKDNSQTRKNVEKVKWFFPKVLIAEMFNIETNGKNIFLLFLMSDLKLNEKSILFSILHQCFKNNTILIKSYLETGFSKAYSMRDFYDFENEAFFYTKDLFIQFYLFIKKILRSKGSIIKEPLSNKLGKFWAKEINFSCLINQIDARNSLFNQFDLNISNLNDLLRFHDNLENEILDINKFKESRKKYFFNYIKSIKIFPLFQYFGFGQYFLYFYPIDLNEIDFKHLLHNSFQSIKLPANIENSNSFLIKFLWPYRNPNNSLLNWLTKSKKVIREYCLFFVKKIFQIFNFNYNLTVNKWEVNPNEFKRYFQNVFFNQDYDLTVPMLKEVNIGDLNPPNYINPESSEFEALIQLYNWKSTDIKSFLLTRKYKTIEQIKRLIMKKLVFPYISTKNLHLIKKIYIILPKLKKKFNKKLIKIFSFFNIGFIYEVEGEYYINGFEKEVKFENGFMIKLYLPSCQLNEFEDLFDLIFQYMEVDHYVILNDLINGKEIFKSIYGNSDFLNDYNPLLNLIWNEFDKIWMNQKLFNEKFEKIYPPLTKNK